MSTSTLATSLEAVGSKGIGLRVEFHRDRDRYAHRVLGFNGDGKAVCLLESVEELPSSAWPCSPVLQGLNVEDLNRKHQTDEVQLAAMLIGMAGDGHWSLVVKPTLDDRTTGLVFEAACRVKSLPPQFTSSYRIADQIKQDASSTGCRLETYLGNFCIQPLALANQPTKSCQLVLRNNVCRLTAEAGWDVSPPVTIQWAYAISIS